MTAARERPAAITPRHRRQSPPPIYRFVPQTIDALPIELQPLDARHKLHRMGLHGHSFFELIFFERRGGSHVVGPQAYAIEPGSLFVIPPGELHDCSAVGSGTGWVLLFTQEALDGVASASRAYVPHWPPNHALLSPFLAMSRRRWPLISVPAADRPRWSDRFARLERELDERPPGYRHGVQAHLSLILLDLMRLVGAGDAPDLVADPRLQAAFDFIERSFRRPISAQDVARAVGRSVAHLTTSMRRRTGLTAGAWITERRMAEARRLLVATALDLDAIADHTGYSGADALARVFRRMHRMTPTAWRDAHRGQPPYA